MKLAIITYVARESSKELATALHAEGIECMVVDANNYCLSSLKRNSYTHVFSYGCSAKTPRGLARLNAAHSVTRCVDKVATFKALKKAGIPIPEYVTKSSLVPSSWEWVVCRESRAGRKAEGYEVREADNPVEGWELYTKWFDHVREYRVVVFREQVFVFYKKATQLANGEKWHEFKLQRPRKHLAMYVDAIKAAEALRMDYVGFDVLVNSKGKHLFLEANSAAILTDEAKAAIVNYYKGLK